MASSLSSTYQFHSFKNPFTFRSSRFILSIPFYSTTTPLLHSRFSFSLKASSSSSEADKSVFSQGKEEDNTDDEEEEEEEKWIDWEDQILEDTVPLVGFVRMILHSGQYESGERLSPEHEKTILEKLLPFHPESEKKIGCGIDYITIGHHPDFDRSRCLFIVRKDGELVDFSFWKCIKGLIRKNYPLYADSFILRHFRKKSSNL